MMLLYTYICSKIKLDNEKKADAENQILTCKAPERYKHGYKRLDIQKQIINLKIFYRIQAIQYR